MDKITFEMSFEGLITGGIPCFTQEDTSGEKEVINNLPEWIEVQLLDLQKIAKIAHQQGEKRSKAFRMIWIGDTVYPFATLYATVSKYCASYMHPECRNECHLESTRTDDISFDIAIRASKVSDLNLKW
ncbi:MAG: hypothetical protein WA584_13040 [Pyrinomonadaceae bacterium]